MPRLSKAVNLGLLIGILGLLINLSPIDLEENIGLDLLFKFRGHRVPPSEVIIVAMDEDSFNNFNLPAKSKKWPRSLHASLIENLVKKGTTVNTFDIIFDEFRSPEEDNLFSEVIKNAGNVVLCECIKKEIVSMTNKEGTSTGDLIIERVVQPIPLFVESALALAPFPLPRVPFKVSQYWKFKTSAGDMPTLPVIVFQIFALEVYDEFIQLLGRFSPSQVKELPPDKDTIIKTKGIKELIENIRNIFKKKPLIAEKMLSELEISQTSSVDERKIRILKSLIRMYQGPDSQYLNFYGHPGAITTIPYYQVLQNQEEVAINQKQIDFKDKAVFIGLSTRTQPEQKDGYYTPFTNESSGLDISGVEIAATAFANLLEDMPVRPLCPWAQVAVIFLWGMVLGIICTLFPSVVGAAGMIGLSILYLIIIYYQFKIAGIWYPLVLPLFFQAPVTFFVSILWKYSDTHRERQNIRKAFGYFLPNKVVDHLVKNMTDIRKNYQMVYGTCLCTDAENYTSFSETMAPKELSTFLNKYYETIFEPVRKHKGIISDIKGDSMLAIWATTCPDAALRNHACLAALEIFSAVHFFNQSYDNLRLPIRIGLHSGHILLGTIGAVNHYEYRPVGDIVNTVSRIESLNKYIGTQLLVSEEVLYQLDGFLTREIGKFLLAGKSNPIVVYELICRMEDSTKEQIELCAIFTNGLSAFKRQSWDEAIEIFHDSMKFSKGNGPSTFYLKLCEQYKENPPEERWDGLVCMQNK